MLGAQVDDLVWCCFEGSEYLVDRILKCFELKKTEQDKFRFCGREYAQSETTASTSAVETAQRRFSRSALQLENGMEKPKPVMARSRRCEALSEASHG